MMSDHLSWNRHGRYHCRNFSHAGYIMSKNTRTILIEGDGTINPESLRVVSDDAGLEFVFLSRDDTLSPEPIAQVIDATRLARVVFGVDMVRLLISLRKAIQARLGMVEAALDTSEPDPNAALEALNSLREDINSAIKRITDTVPAQKKIQERGRKTD